MAAIITETFRRNSAKLLLNDIAYSDNEYYIGIGKSDDWYEPLSIGTTAPFPAGTAADTFNATYALTNLIKVTASAADAVIPRVKAEFGKQYKIYDPYDPSCFYSSGNIKPCYVVTESGIFLCIGKQSPDSIFSESSILDPETLFINPQYNINNLGNYFWAFLGTYDNYDPINTEQFIKISLGSVTNPAIAPTKGLLYGFKVINGGIYPQSISTAGKKLIINGTNELGVNLTTVEITDSLQIQVTFTAHPTVANAMTITSVRYPDLFVQQYNNYAAADVKIQFTDITATENAVIAPLLSPISGFAATPSDVLPSWYIGIVANTNITTPAAFSQYGQISLIRNPKSQNDTILNQAVCNTLKSFTLKDEYTDTLFPLILNEIIPGSAITQSIDGGNINIIKVGIIDSINYDTGTIYYTQNIKYGYTSLLPNTSIKFILPSGLDVYTLGYVTRDLSPGDYKHGTGEMVFLENRSPIIRTADQNEELKLIIQL